MNINIDFDGTCVEHDYPRIGKEIPNCVSTLKKLVHNGHNLILFTMRDSKELFEAVQWFKERDIPLFGVNTNPTQIEWTTSPKSYADIMIDDTAIGCPLYDNPNGRPHVDWFEVESKLILMDIIKK